MEYVGNATVKVTCPNCGTTCEAISDDIYPEDLGISSDIVEMLSDESLVNKVKTAAKMTPLDLAPKIELGLKPTAAIYVYKITTEDIKEYITKKARYYQPNVKIELAPRYCEKKRRSPSEHRHSYASLRIAFSHDIIDKDDEYGWYGRIGMAEGRVKIEQNIFDHMIKRYRYDRKTIDKWLSSYKTLEELEENLGMTEAFINDIRRYSIPQAVKAGEEEWVIFSAAPENIILDMMRTGFKDGKNILPGTIKIEDVYPISKDIIEFIIYVYPEEKVLEDNSHVRAIINGEKDK